ncbi:MAG: T9SS type A sorting domain-containing protein [bacterium]|nr:T9SS type A sorting domain-containing protein [bacterium]
MNVRRIICVGVFLAFSCRVAPFDKLKAEQIPIERVELMPNEPSPYHMRDWEKVAIDYDEFVFNFNATGQFLPLGWWDWGRANLPTNSFGMRSYVKEWPTGGSGEAINCIAAVVSATLVGIDKSDQCGNNFVYMCQNWCNPSEKMIMNNPTERNPCSFWYVLLPNILFDQLVYYYPDTLNMSTIMYEAADQWYNAADVMRKDENGFAYEGFNFNTMEPATGGHKEPDAAAGIAWIEYMAFVKFNKTRFLNAADSCLQWLTSLTYNPLYEILLPYGAYTAARMNGELGRNYDIHKLINWCFGPGSPEARKGWGVIAENWEGYDCHGLHGSITDGGGYAFAMGTFENVGCLVPLVRYDDRYARAIGKYVLNAANAARLFYGNGLDVLHQDSEDWIDKYDENYCIGYEALRKVWGGISPLATGDVNRDRYRDQTGDTNLGLYGSSHVGIFGGIIKPTNHEKILQLDCLVTDYFHDTAYPTYLYYNPYNDAKTIEIDVGQDPKDLYDATTNDFLATNVSDLVSFILPANSAVLLVFAPANGIITYDNNKTLINGVVVDYISNSHSCDETLHEVPKAYTLAQSYPNPFNNETVILFTLPKGGEVSLKVYDVMGQEVATLIDGKMEAGEHSINWVAKDLTSGVYICRLSFNGFEKIKKMLLVR